MTPRARAQPRPPLGCRDEHDQQRLRHAAGRWPIRSPARSTASCSSIVRCSSPTGRAATPCRCASSMSSAASNRYITTGSSDRPMYIEARGSRASARRSMSSVTAARCCSAVPASTSTATTGTRCSTSGSGGSTAVLVVIVPGTRAPPGSPVNCAVVGSRSTRPGAAQAALGPSGLPEVFLVANDLKPPKTYQFSGGVRQGIGGRSLITLSYNGVRGENGMNFVRASAKAAACGPQLQPGVRHRRPREDAGTTPCSCRSIVRSSADTRWGGSIAYTLARSQEQGQTTDIFWGFDDKYPTVGDLPRRRAPGNQTHTVMANGIVRAAVRRSTSARS